MKKSLEELTNVAINLQLFLGVSSFTLHVYDSRSYVEIVVRSIKKLPDLLDLISGLEVTIFGDGDNVVVRVFEREDESECYSQ